MARYTPVPLAFKAVDPNGGASDKSPIIFLHGMTVSKENWGDILQTVANATKRKVYAIDARNHGDSEWSDVFDLDCNVDDTLHFMDTMMIQKAILCGHSMGGITSIKTALRMPERVEKVVIEDISIQKLPQEITGILPVFYNVARLALQQVPSGVDEDTAKKIILGFIIEQLPEKYKPYLDPRMLEEHFLMQLKRTEDGGYAFKPNLNVLETALSDESALMSNNTGLYEGPALFIYGELSHFKVGLDEPNIKKLFPNAELHGVAKTGHNVHGDSPHEFMETVLAFLLKE